MKPMRVLLDRGIAPIVIEQFQSKKLDVDIVTLKEGMLQSLLEHGNYSALLLRSKISLPRHALEAAGRNLRVIGVVGDSLDNINVTDASRKGILVKATDYVNAYEVANLSLRLIVTLLSRAFRERKADNACVITDNQELLKKDLSGFELAGTTLGLIGCGKVAQSLAMQIQPYCDRIIGYDNKPKSVYENFHRRTPLERAVIEYGQLREVLEYSDVISIHTAGTDRVFKDNELFFAQRKPYIVNTSLTGHVDEVSLLDALHEKRIRGVAFTLPATQLKNNDYASRLESFLPLKNVLIAPAVGEATPDKKKKSSRRLAQSVIDFLLHEDLSLAVNPMEVYPGSREQQYPISRRERRSAIPLLLGQ
jgi:phosphoglycerate dehydrogenase-like enzyme